METSKVVISSCTKFCFLETKSFIFFENINYAEIFSPTA